jgi:uncharacterized protein (DUF58 family)
VTLWDPEVLARIRHLSLVARHAVDGVQHGRHPSRAVGSSVEFEDYKEYAPGDPIAKLDWRVAARSDRLVVRRHRAESQLPVWIALDASGDMSTGVRSLGHRAPRAPLDGSKMGFAICLAATVAWYLQLQGEPVGLALMGGMGSPWESLQPRTGRRHLGRVLGALASVEPSGQADLEAGVNLLAGRLQRSCLVVLISDLMEEPEGWGRSLRALGQRRAELRVLHLQDPGELALDYPRVARFFSPEGGEPVALDPGASRAEFSEIVRAWRREVELLVRSVRGRYLPVDTSRPLAEPLLRLLRSGTAIRPAETGVRS